MTFEGAQDHVDIYRGQDPASIPFCTLRECSDWLRLPYSTVRAWFLGQAGFEPVLALSDPTAKKLSFVNVTEVFVLAAIRRKHQIPLPRVREAVHHQELALAYMQRIERNAAGVPVRLYPFTRPDIKDAPTSVVIDPRIQYGRPCLSGTGIPTAVIHERWLAGEDMQEIAHDYGRELADVQEALRFEDRRAA